VSKLPTVKYFNLSLEIQQISRKYHRLPSVKYWLRLEEGEQSYLPSKSKLELVHQRDECWLDCNDQSHGSVRVALELSRAEQLMVKKIFTELVHPKRHGRCDDVNFPDVLYVRAQKVRKEIR
jgi:hypothetical protein